MHSLNQPLNVITRALEKRICPGCFLSGTAVLVFFLLASHSQLDAQVNYSWNDANTGTWTISGNWNNGTSNSGVPGSSDNIVTPTLFTGVRLAPGIGETVTNWTFNPTLTTANVTWTATSAFGTTTVAAVPLAISGTLTVDDNNGSGAYTNEMLFKDYAQTNSPLLSVSVGAVAVNNGYLYFGAAPASATLYSVNVSGLTTIGGSTVNTPTHLDINLDGTAGTANFGGGISFGNQISTVAPEYFYFNTSAASNLATVAFLSGGNQYAVVEGDSTGAATSTLVLNGNSGGTYTFAGLIKDTSAGNLTVVSKTGNNTQVFTGASTYSGGTTISAGTLGLGSTATSSNGVNVLSKSPSIAVASGATLSLISAAATSSNLGLMNAAINISVVDVNAIALSINGSTENIGEFIINNVPQPLGLYSASSVPVGASSSDENYFVAGSSGYLNVTAVPEPASVGLLGLTGLTLLRRRGKLSAAATSV